MSLCLIRTNLRMSRGVLLAWGGSLFLMGLFVALLYDSIKEVSGLEEYLEAIPEQIMSAMGIRDEADLAALIPQGTFSLEGFIGVEFLTWWPILMGIYAIFAAGGLIAQEAEGGTIDLLLSQPITRHQVLASKFLVFLVNLAAMAVASLVGIILGLAIIGQWVEPVRVALALFQGWLLVVAIAGYCALLSCLFLDPRRVRIAAGLVTAALYIMSFVGPSLGPLRWLERLSPFYYFDATDIMLSGALDGTGLAYSLALALTSLTAAIVVFRRRDVVS